MAARLLAISAGALLMTFPVLGQARLPHFPASAPWYQDISALSPDPESSRMLEASKGWGTGSDRLQIDFSMIVLSADDKEAPTVPLIPADGYLSPDCPRNLRVPLPAGGAVEQSDDYHCTEGDCHLLVFDRKYLYESWQSNVDEKGLHSACAVKWNLDSVYPGGRGQQCTSADAAGFPISPLLIDVDEVAAAVQHDGDLGHAVRFILPNDHIREGWFVAPATHAGAPRGSADAIPYGARLRLKANFDLSGFNPAAQAVLRTLKHYGMFLADGGNVPLTAASDRFSKTKWADLRFSSHSLFNVRLSDFEVMPIGKPVKVTFECVNPAET